jgi:hypothetical protein
MAHQHQGWYALDAEALQQVRRRVAVHLDQPHLRLEPGRRCSRAWFDVLAQDLLCAGNNLVDPILTFYHALHTAKLAT